MKAKEIKKKAKKALKVNYWRCVAIAFFVSMLLGTYKITTNSSIPIDTSKITIKSEPIGTVLNSEILKDTITSITHINESISNYKPTRGVLANVFNNVTSSGSFIFGILNSFNQLIFHERVWQSVLIFLGAILTLLYVLFIRNVFVVGEARFFIENRNFSKTNFHRLLFPYKIRKYTGLGFAMMRVMIQEWLWYFTIIGGVIKHYSYAMVPYILAENPGLSGKEAILLSRRMMQGHKWELFKLDVSLIGWSLLDLFSFHLVGIIFTVPYKNCCFAESYMYFREQAKLAKVEGSEKLCDTYLEKSGEVYPSEKALYKEVEGKKWLHTDYNKNYDFLSLLLMFFVASIAGWIWEVGLHLFQYGEFVNRGTLHGPWLHIYGWGLVLLLVLLKKTRNKPILTFLLAILICGTLEYATGWYLEVFKNARYWDYDGFFLNLHGRICLEGLIVFGLGGCSFIYFAAPFLDSLFSRIPKKLKFILCILLSFFYIVDFAYSSIHPNSGEGVSQEFINQLSRNNYTFSSHNTISCRSTMSDLISNCTYF